MGAIDFKKVQDFLACDKQTVLELILIYQNELKEALSIISKPEQDLERIKKVAHKLNGTAKLLGLKDFEASLSKIESCAMDSEWTATNQTMKTSIDTVLMDLSKIA